MDRSTEQGEERGVSAQSDHALCGTISLRPHGRELTFVSTHHLERPYSPDPHLQPAFNALDTLEVHALPPAAPRGLAPEQQQLLGHADGVAGQVVAADIGAEAGERDTADDGLVGLVGAVTPSVVVVEAAVRSRISHCYSTSGDEWTHPAVNISMRCCSVVPGSSLFLNPENIPSCFNSAFPAALFTSIISCASIFFLGGIA